MAGADVYHSATGVATVDTLGGATDTSRAEGTYTITEDDYTMSDGTGRGASFTIAVNGSGVTTISSVDSPGDGYAVDDTFLVQSEKIGDAVGGTDLTFDEFAEVFGVYDILNSSVAQTGSISDMYVI